ncbi:hypothetical protein C5C30_08330 [Rathayibacter sp. AY2B5]|nr:hypothetical protein C5C30_08330 [Rathayibacter sp. AY2B5]
MPPIWIISRERVMRMQSKAVARVAEVAMSLLLPITLLAGCAGAPEQPVVERTAQMAVQYPFYDLPQLVQEADRIIEGTAVSTSDVIQYPTYEGDDPLVNPLSDLSEEEQRASAREGAIAATEVQLEVTVVHKGAAEEQITITQTGGVMDGVLYTTTQEPLLAPGTSYLLFLSDGERPYLLGGGAGSYEEADGTYSAMVEHAPVESLTRDELAALITEDHN